jgi:hypothetical protein
MKSLGLAAGCACVLAVIGVAACSASTAVSGHPGADGGATATPDAGTTKRLPCDVDKVLAENCRKCHSATPQYGAVMPLDTLADLQATAPSDPSKKVYELVADRIASDAKPMPPPPNPRLTAAERSVLTQWAAAGAPAATDSSCTSDGGTKPTTPQTKCTPDLPLAPATAWEMPNAKGDEYVCYGVDLQRTTPTHVIGFSPRIDNTKIVHHVVLFEAEASFGSTPQPCSAGGSLQWRMVMGWAPGAKGLDLPEEAGFPIKTTDQTHYVVQVHYSNPQGLAGERDASGFDLCTAAPRKYEADVMAFGTQKIDIPAGKGTKYERTCSITVPNVFGSVNLVAAMPHMHKLGTAMSTTLNPSAGGPPTDLGTVTSWSFDTQAWLPATALVKPGDVITTRCAWTNDRDQPVSFGERTDQEMCYSFTLYYPKVQSTLWSWAAPAIGSSCK